LYYSNANAEPGSVTTTFPYNRVPGRQGSGQISTTDYTIPKGTAKFWKEHLDDHRVENSGIQERFGQAFVRFRHPSGLQFEVLEEEDKRVGWTTDEITKDVATRGFHGAVLSVREVGETERFFVDALGFRKTGVDGAYHRFEIGKGGAARTVELLHEPDRPQGSWIFGAGTPHHIALEVPTDEDLQLQKDYYDELGYTDCSEIKDRNYFHSIYCRCPGGILVECACTAPGGFARDEPFNQLGSSLLLPPWFEHRRPEIVKMLEPIRLPEYHTAAASSANGGISMSRRDSAEFIEAGKN